MQQNVFLFFLSVLAIWRITHLFSKEDGPFDLIFSIRKYLGAGFWGSLMDCFYCLSIWVSFPFGIVLGQGFVQKLLYWIACSGAACLLEQATSSNKKDPPSLPDYTED